MLLSLGSVAWPFARFLFFCLLGCGFVCSGPWMLGKRSIWEAWPPEDITDRPDVLDEKTILQRELWGESG